MQPPPEDQGNPLQAPPAPNNNDNIVYKYEPIKKNAGNQPQPKNAAPLIPLSRPAKRRSKGEKSGNNSGGGPKSQGQGSQYGEDGGGDSMASGNLDGQPGRSQAQDKSNFSTTISRKKFLWYEKGRDNTFCKLLIIVIIFGILHNVFCILCLVTDFFSQLFYSEYK